MVKLCLVTTQHSIVFLFRTTMSDPNRFRENRLRGKFKGLLDRFMGADCLRIECPRPSGLRLDFITLKELRDIFPPSSLVLRRPVHFCRSPHLSLANNFMQPSPYKKATSTLGKETRYHYKYCHILDQSFSKLFVRPA